MHVIDEQTCFKCGLCVTWCPSEAITGVNRRSVSHSLVYDRVYIDADVCIDCGSCMTEGRMCPAEAIYDGAAGQPERVSADGTKYDKYIYHYDFEHDDYYAPDSARSPRQSRRQSQKILRIGLRTCRGSGLPGSTMMLCPVAPSMWLTGSSRTKTRCRESDTRPTSTRTRNSSW